VLTDFGIAMTAGASSLTRTGEMVGSIHYMAPERVRGRQPGPASDLWALGATLYQAVEGRPPYRRITAMETAYAIAVDPPEPMKHAGPLEPLVEALLLKEPDERPTVEQTERALRAVLSGAPTEDLPRGTATTVSTGASSALRDGAAQGPAEDTHTEPVSPAGGRSPSGGRRGGGRGRRTYVLVAAAAAAVVLAGTTYVVTEGTSDDGARSRSSTAPSSRPSPVPEGFHEVSEKQLGVSFPVPDGWKRAKASAQEVIYTDPTDLVRLSIGMVDPAGSHPVEHFADIEANTRKNYATYRRLRMQRSTFRGEPAAVWEFTFQGRARVFRAIDLGFGRAGGREYDIYLSAPDADWDTHRPVFDAVRDGFTKTGG
jgi:hypothetical protein